MTSKEQPSLFPPAEFQQSARTPSLQSYEEMYQRSIQEPEKFWADLARTELVWEKPWSAVCTYNWKEIGKNTEPYVSWFAGGSLNVSANCLDRHMATAIRSKPALIWEAEKEGESRTLTYEELLEQVCRLANVLKKHGLGKGSTIGIFMPMVPELAIAVLACARIGAIHSVVFSAFSAEALRSRLQDCKANFLITADASFYAGRLLPIKSKADEAVSDCPSVSKMLVLERAKISVKMLDGRDLWWHEEMQSPDISSESKADAFDSETPLFILYTSGSTGKPKGVLHTSAGYLLHAHASFKYFFDIREDDIYWCTADVGWITGHSYLLYGPLSNGATCVMYEGAPLQPDPERSWKIIQKNRVSIFYTAPTAIRSFMKLGEELPGRHDLSSLRLLGSVGEPINPEAWRWYHRVIGQSRCPVVDTWWQTETGGIMISTFPGAMEMKPGSAGKPFFGVAPQVLKDSGEAAATNEAGILVITKPWPGMLRGVFGDASHSLISQTYFSRFPGLFFTGDGAQVDSDGYYWLLGRVDDVLNVSGHRLSTAELESALVSHHSVAESAVVGFPHETKGVGIYCFVTPKSGVSADANLAASLREQVRHEIGPIATPDKIQFCEALPKTRSGKIMRRVLRKIAEGKPDEVGDVSTLADPAVVKSIIEGMSF